MIAVSHDLLEEVTERLVAEFHPEQIWMFGSHAWGVPTADSDLDPIVIVPESNEPPAQRMRRALRCLRGLDIPKDILVQTRAEFDRYRDVRASLTYKIVHQGHKLYG